MVEHGDLLSVCKQAPEDLLARFERKQKMPKTHLITFLLNNHPHHIPRRCTGP